jgi:hypothetical protein
MALLPTLPKMPDLPYKALPAYMPESVYYEGGILEFLCRGYANVETVFDWINSMPMNKTLPDYSMWAEVAFVPGNSLIFLRRGGQSAFTTSLAMVERLADLITTTMASKCWVWKDGGWREGVMARIG